MAKYKSVEEALDDMRGRIGKNGEILPNRFNKKKFNYLMVAMMNDPNFKEKVAVIHKDDHEIEEIMVTKEFRKWCKYLVEKAGMDSIESERIMSDDFKIDKIDGLYEFFVAAIYEFMKMGNRFDLLPQEDFKASLELVKVPEQKKKRKAKNPITGEDLGEYETHTMEHTELRVKSKAPKWLSKKRRIG